MIRSILVAIDESKSSKAALNASVALARVCGAKLKGLYVENIMRLLEWQPVELMGAAVGISSSVPSSRPTIEQVNVEKQFLEEEKNLKKVFEDTCKKFALSGQFIVKRGRVEETIIEESRKVDFVVLGRRGKTYPENATEPGPTTEELLRQSTRPILVVPEDVAVNNRILIAYDGGQNAQRALFVGAGMAELLNFEIRVVSVADDIDAAQKSLDEAREFLSAYKVKASYITGFGYSKPWAAIMEQAKNFDAGVIVLGAFGEKRLLELIFGSTTRNVLTQTKCPVLLCR